MRFPYYSGRSHTCTVLCAKRVENGFLHTLGITSVILHAIHTQDISTRSPIFTDHNDITSHDSHVRTMAEIADMVVRIG